MVLFSTVMISWILFPDLDSLEEYYNQLYITNIYYQYIIGNNQY